MAADEMITLGTCERCGVYHGSWEPCGPRFTPEEAAKNDIAAIRHALGLPDSPRHLAEVQDDILPAIAALLAAVERGEAETARLDWLFSDLTSDEINAKVEDVESEFMKLGRYDHDAFRAAIDAARAHPPIQETDDAE